MPRYTNNDLKGSRAWMMATSQLAWQLRAVANGRFSCQGTCTKAWMSVVGVFAAQIVKGSMLPESRPSLALAQCHGTSFNILSLCTCRMIHAIMTAWHPNAELAICKLKLRRFVCTIVHGSNCSPTSTPLAQALTSSSTTGARALHLHRVDSNAFEGWAFRLLCCHCVAFLPIYVCGRNEDMQREPFSILLTGELIRVVWIPLNATLW